MAPVTRSSSKKSDVQVLWYGGENADQDLSICLESNNQALAYVMVHSSRLMSCSSYFAASLSPRWASKKRKRNPKQITLHVDHGDLRLYTDCFSRMYSPPFYVGKFKSVKYSLDLLPVATQLAYDDLMSSICFYLASIRPWSQEDEMRIRMSVLSVGFPSGHAADLLEQLEGPMTKNEFRPLITACMKSLCASSKQTVIEAKELFGHLLKEAARVQERGFEQDVMKIINEEFRLLLSQAHDEVEAADTLEKVRATISKLKTSQQVLEMLVAAGVADEGVKWFVRYNWYHELNPNELFDNEGLDIHVKEILGSFVVTIMMILKEVEGGNVCVKSSDRYRLLRIWAPFFHSFHIVSQNGTRYVDEWIEYERVTKALLQFV